MERICTIKDVRKGRFSDGFAASFANEHQLLQLILADQPAKRPTTFGIKARPPLNQQGRIIDQVASSSSANGPSPAKPRWQQQQSNSVVGWFPRGQRRVAL